MRFYEKRNGTITPVDLSSSQLSEGKLVIKLNNDQLTYHVCILADDEVRLYDILTKHKIPSLSSHYQTYNPNNHTFTRLGKIGHIPFSIPTHYSLTPQEQSILLFIDRTQDLKNELFNNDDFSFHGVMVETYWKYALTFIEIVLKTLNLHSLKNALTIHWDNIKGNALCYTALPNDPITILFCDIAKFLAQELNETAISLLMPTISTESQFNDFPDLTTLDLQTIIHTHIINTDGNYLIPINLLSKREMNIDASSDYPTFEIATINTNKLVSPYYQYDLHGDQAYLDADTVDRLFSFCTETETMLDAIKQHQAFMQDDHNLLGQLMRLTHLLKKTVCLA